MLFNCGTYCFLRFEAYAERQTIHKAITYLADSRQNVGPLVNGQPHSIVANNVVANELDPKVIGKFVIRSGY